MMMSSKEKKEKKEGKMTSVVDDFSAYFGCKYLTSSDLLVLQVRDPSFRLQLGAQILFYINYLRYIFRQICLDVVWHLFAVVRQITRSSFLLFIFTSHLISLLHTSFSLPFFFSFFSPFFFLSSDLILFRVWKSQYPSPPHPWSLCLLPKNRERGRGVKKVQISAAC